MKKKKKFPALLFITVFIAVGLIGIVLLNVSQMNRLASGLENYTGAERQAAETMLDNFDNFDDGIGTAPGFAKLRVTSVAFTPKGSCTSRDDYNSYTVTLKTVSWFGVIVNKKSDSICRMYGGT